MIERILIEGCAVATVDGAGTEYPSGHLVVTGGRISAVGPGPAPDLGPGPVRRIDGTGCLATPGLVNTHHHLYQWLTKGLAQQCDLFGWLTALYPVWGRLDAEAVAAAAGADLAWLLLNGCTTSTDHHYVFPAGGGDLLAAEIETAAATGIRFHPCRGSMDLGQSAGGLPPDDLVEETEAALLATEEAIARYHDPAPESMLRIAVAPCSPFSASGRLMRSAAELARRTGVRLHTHLAETVDEEEYCKARFGRTPVEYLAELDWLGDDVWFAHGVHLSAEAIDHFAATGSAVAHCPSSNARLGAGIAPVRQLLDAGVPVGLGVDGAASQEGATLAAELRQALLVARLRGGPSALSARQALAAATIGGARCLGRDRELGSLEAGKLADLVLWRIDTLAHATIADPVAALVLGPPPPVALVLVNGRTVVEDGQLRTTDAAAASRRAAQASRLLCTGERS